MIFLDSRLRGNDKCGAFSFPYSVLILMMIGFNGFSEFSVCYFLFLCDLCVFSVLPSFDQLFNQFETEFDQLLGGTRGVFVFIFILF